MPLSQMFPRLFLTAYVLLGSSAFAATSDPAASFENYNCAASSPNLNHYGQVINNTYTEWTVAYIQGATGPSITCMTTIAPTAAQLSQADAEALFAASQAVGSGGASTATSHPSVARQQSVDATDVSALPPATDVTTGTMTSTSGTGAPTSPQQLMGDVAHNDYATLDLGYGPPKTTSVAKASSIGRAQTIGTDDRVLVTDPTLTPYNLIGQLTVTWRDGTQSICTGVLVSANVVLTAGACTHNRERGGFAARATFAPGQNQSAALAAVTQANGSRDADYVETNNRWTLISGSETIQTTDARSDYGAYYFVQPWTFTSTFMPIAYDNTQGGTINSSGYPTAVHSQSGINQAQWYASGSETTRSVNTLRTFQVREYTIDASAGDNGAPFWIYDGVTRSIVGILSYGSDDLAGGVWFGGENKATVQTMAAWTPSQSAPAHTSSNLRVAGVFASNSTQTSSFVRFYNPTPQTATVTVRISDATTGTYLGTWTSPTLAAYTSMQYDVRTLEYDATPRISPTGHSQYTLNVSATIGMFFQHVIWNQVGVSLTNMSGCGNGWANDVTHTNNAHSSIVQNYPSVIIVHNLDLTASDATLGFYDSKTGIRIGGVKIPNIPSDAGVQFAVTDAEKAMNFTPNANQDHLNIVLEGDFLGYMQHEVYNTGAGVITNLSAKCYIAP